MAEPIQQPLPLAFIHGEAMVEKPEDLYIPPDALAVILESFEGPLDLLLYLIRRQKFEVVDLPVRQITKQYMEYVEVMTELKLELAGEYLLMAAMLAEIKSRVLLPKRDEDDVDEADPRAELIRRLKEYELIKKAALELDTTPRHERDVFIAKVDTSSNVKPIRIDPEISLQALSLAFYSAMKRASAYDHHQIAREVLSTRERMAKLLEKVSQDSFISLDVLLDNKEGKAGVVVTFLAILELVKEGLLQCLQSTAFAPIHVKLGGDE